MRLITTQFIFILLLLFVLDLCNAASKQSKSSMALQKFHIRPNQFFEEQCEKEIKYLMKLGGHNKGDNPSSQECMLLCGVYRLGAIDNPPLELTERFLEEKIIGPTKQEALKQIHMCTRAVKIPDAYMCSRAMKLLDCALEHIVDTKSIKDELKKIMVWG
ncbi:uncharacterized protein LOC135850050 [Planococcus citri]|uniref:uncharacterized protein LOC135850050 n=1 Tax=Planococcus citri TaxID=170843 RepID=UPI0031F8FF8C